MAQSILVNDNVIIKDTEVINSFIEPHIFLNKMIRGTHDLKKNAIIVDMDARHDFRPDRLAYEYYGQDFWYPAILIANNLGSMIQFNAESLNFKVNMPNISDIRMILGQEDTPIITIDSIANSIFNV